MKRVQVALWVAITLIFAACETNLTQPNFVQDSVIEFGGNSLAKDLVYVAELDSILPDSTVYGPLDDSTKIFWATGGELIPGDYWVDNLHGSPYKTHLYAEMKASFGRLVSVKIAYPSNMEYLDAKDKWTGITAGGWFSAKAVRTGLFGGGVLTTAEGYDVEDEGGGGQH